MIIKFFIIKQKTFLGMYNEVIFNLYRLKWQRLYKVLQFKLKHIRNKLEKVYCKVLQYYFKITPPILIIHYLKLHFNSSENKYGLNFWPKWGHFVINDQKNLTFINKQVFLLSAFIENQRLIKKKELTLNLTLNLLDKIIKNLGFF